jgi:hypothetical protein
VPLKSTVTSVIPFAFRKIDISPLQRTVTFIYLYAPLSKLCVKASFLNILYHVIAIYCVGTIFCVHFHMDTHRASGLHGTRFKNVSCTESDTCTTAYVFVDMKFIRCVYCCQLLSGVTDGSVLSMWHLVVLVLTWRSAVLALQLGLDDVNAITICPTGADTCNGRNISYSTKDEYVSELVF